jgi:oxygen-independent coproporphyrinogen-3 oxidase
MFLGLRLLDGMDLNQASHEAGIDLGARYQAEIGELIDLGLLEQEGSCLRLTQEAYLIANQVFTRFLG